MSRIAACLEACKASGRKAVIPYIVAGDPWNAITVPAMHTLVKAGADIIELGVPFSDPMAEGPVIQLGHERALAHNVGMGDVLAMVAEFRQQDPNTPVVLMGYANPVEVMGYDAFAKAATTAGVDGVLTVDMPPEEAGDMNAVFREYQLDTIFLIAPTTTESRTKAICAMATGYIYYVSLKGVTGAGHIDTDEVKRKVNGIKASTSLPVCVGFGIKDGDSAAAIGQCADGVVVGSVLVNGMGESVGMATRDDDADPSVDPLAGKDRVALAEVVNARILSIVSEIAEGANR